MAVPKPRPSFLSPQFAAPFFRRLSSSPSPSPSPSGDEKDAELVSNLLLQQHNPFHATESSLQLHGITLTPNLLFQSLLRLKHHSKIALSLFNYSKTLPNPPLTIPSYNLLIDIMAKVRQFDVASQLIVEMHQRNLSPTPSTFLILIRRLICAGLTRQAVRTFDDIDAFSDSKTTPDHFCLLLDTLCKYGHVKLAVEVFNRNKRDNRFRPNVKMYTVLIYGWCKLGRVKTAQAFLKEMLELGIEANVVTYNVLLNGVCRRVSLHPEERFERTIRNAEEVFDQMRESGIEPDVTSFSIVLHVYSRAHKPQLSLDKLRLMKEKGICPNVVTYTSVIKCLCSCGRLDDAEGLLDEMVRNGVSPCAATYNCFFKEFRGRDDGDSALRLFKKMKDDGLCPPTSHTYGILMRMFLRLNKIGVVKEMWNDMKETGAGPDLDLYTVLIHGLCQRQSWKEACHFFVEMIENGFLPQKVTFEILYKGLIQSDMLRTWRRLKKKLDEESITFGSEFQNYQLKPYRR
ncbi:pentatricopeptide repeat-containing protein At2g13420, mitochondrial-like [Abrus precatorius]|uniref:Pentatricopeptide repeat-containing protein At2g13420, mitochondrial-like n=1 Tax=Abrus precatorius TaxID=3816 RepID=A0A8B8JJB8_ABRPR|nr:pentatricopeptide repeat-containing protein At2g13420, mitochondrial-like [Abrus precatorius]XP_027331507.1 pentatricopeptide repeat-containing protein At2g13420, mitochondrial-like [Abrus precatorius]XP_027331508.1 pentatricopeptide repeat-containing protein At2g13420, mitochondrial-like [Abrus precatorius]XP_027331510.1 pentatricopeptide repeat-containing protein At2g13420, mitochondrial-like [Abrus precatorius]XP_027331511.1 pentatricopeptide repeat-containing protein At2g13420, mitochond